MEAQKGSHYAEVVEEVLRVLGVSVILGPEVLEVHYPEEKLLIKLFSIKSNLSIYAF